MAKRWACDHMNPTLVCKLLKFITRAQKTLGGKVCLQAVANPIKGHEEEESMQFLMSSGQSKMKKYMLINQKNSQCKPPGSCIHMYG